MNTMKLKDGLSSLKTDILSRNLSIEEVQRSLSKLLLSNCNSIEMERITRKFDNDLELVIHTLNSESQIEATVKVLDEALEYVKNFVN